MCDGLAALGILVANVFYLYCRLDPSASHQSATARKSAQPSRWCSPCPSRSSQCQCSLGRCSRRRLDTTIGAVLQRTAGENGKSRRERSEVAEEKEETRKKQSSGVCFTIFQSESIVYMKTQKSRVFRSKMLQASFSLALCTISLSCHVLLPPVLSLRLQVSLPLY